MGEVTFYSKTRTLSIPLPAIVFSVQKSGGIVGKHYTPGNIEFINYTYKTDNDKVINHLRGIIKNTPVSERLFDEIKPEQIKGGSVSLVLIIDDSSETLNEAIAFLVMNRNVSSKDIADNAKTPDKFYSWAKDVMKVEFTELAPPASVPTDPKKNDGETAEELQAKLDQQKKEDELLEGAEKVKGIKSSNEAKSWLAQNKNVGPDELKGLKNVDQVKYFALHQHGVVFVDWE